MVRDAAELASVAVIGPLAANIAGMIKYGVPSAEAAWAMTSGVASRRAALAVADEFLRTRRQRSVTEFRRWFGRLDPDSVADQLGLTGGELESTARAILRSQPNDYLAVLDDRDTLLPLRATSRPLRSAVESGLLYELSVGDLLSVRRDRDSMLNRNSVFLAEGNRRLGYLQADAARALGPELDAGVGATATVVELRISEGDDPEVTVEAAESLEP